MLIFLLFTGLVCGAAAGGAVAGQHLRLVRGQRGVVPRRIHLRRGHHLRGAARQQDGQVRGYFFKQKYIMLRYQHNKSTIN